MIAESGPFVATRFVSFSAFEADAVIQEVPGQALHFSGAGPAARSAQLAAIIQASRPASVRRPVICALSAAAADVPLDAAFHAFSGIADKTGTASIIRAADILFASARLADPLAAGEAIVAFRTYFAKLIPSAESALIGAIIPVRIIGVDATFLRIKTSRLAFAALQFVHPAVMSDKYLLFLLAGRIRFDGATAQ